MTTIELKGIPCGCTLTAEGHAEDTRVCAVISSLFQFALAFLVTAGAEIIDRRMEPGDSILSFRGGSDAFFMRDYLSLAFRLLARDYPDNVRFLSS